MVHNKISVIALVDVKQNTEAASVASQAPAVSLSATLPSLMLTEEQRMLENADEEEDGSQARL